MSIKSEINMEVAQRDRAALIQDEENVNVVRDKPALSPTKKTSGATRALGEISANVQVQREITVGKVAIAIAEFEKKASLGRSRRYNDVQSIIDTGLAEKPSINTQPTARTPLHCEESTAAHAAKAFSAKRIDEDDIYKAEPVEEVEDEVDTDDETTEKLAERDRLAELDFSKVKVKMEPIDPDDEPVITTEEEPIVTTVSSESLPTFISQPIQAMKESTTPTIKEPSIVIKKESKENNEIKENKNKVLTKDPVESLGKLKIGENSLDLSVELPADIEDIDAGYSDHLMVTTYSKDIFRYLMELELKYQIQPDHLKYQSFVTPEMRSVLVDWLVDVHYDFKLRNETLQLTVGIIDRYLQVAPTVQRDKFQLIGVTALFIAFKYEESLASNIEDFVYLAEGAYTKKEIVRCEQEILTKLSFSLARPIPHSFLLRFMKAAHGNWKQYQLAKYFVDLCLIDYAMSHYRPSALSAAAICLSIYLVTNKRCSEIWTPAMEFYTSYTYINIEPIIKKLAKIVSNVDNSKNKAVYTKYQDATLDKVSTLPQLKSERLHVIADSE